MPKPLPFIPSTVPADVAHDGVSWEADWAELEWQRQIKNKAFYELKAAQEQRNWFLDSVRRLSLVALEIDKDKREAAVILEQDRVDAFYLECERIRDGMVWESCT